MTKVTIATPGDADSYTQERNNFHSYTKFLFTFFKDVKNMNAVLVGHDVSLNCSSGQDGENEMHDYTILRSLKMIGSRLA